MTHSLMDLQDHDIQSWIERAEDFVEKQGWTYDDFNRPEILYNAAVFLHKMEPLIKTQQQYPYYAVHCMETDTRFVTGSYSTAFSHFKRLDKDGKRAAMFHWKSKAEHERVYASDGYAFKRDYGAQS